MHRLAQYEWYLSALRRRSSSPLIEFDFRYNNRTALGIGNLARADAALTGVEGKRLTYWQPD